MDKTLAFSRSAVYENVAIYSFTATFIP